MAEELRWAIIGTGFISNTVAEAIAASPGSRVALVSGRDTGRVAEFAERHRIARTCVGFADAVTDPDIDVVYVGTPNHTHHDVVTAAAAAGKAVLSEKSLTATMATAHELVDASAHAAYVKRKFASVLHNIDLEAEKNETSKDAIITELGIAERFFPILK